MKHSAGPAVKPVIHASRLVARIAPWWHQALGRQSWPQGQLVFDCTPDTGINGPRAQKSSSAAWPGQRAPGPPAKSCPAMPIATLPCESAALTVPRERSVLTAGNRRRANYEP
jgi:hypothetical protein